jgi:hypothetical protein
VAPRTRVPPIPGINNEEPDGMRAIVISTSGNPKDKKIAYLEKYAPELKTTIRGHAIRSESRAPFGGRVSRGAGPNRLSSCVV